MKIAVFVHNRDFFGAKLIHIPLLWTLKQKYPSSEITVYTPYSNNQIFIETGLVRKVIIYTRAVRNLLSELKSKSFDIVISLRPYSFWLNIVLFLSKIPVRIGFKSIISFLANTETKYYNKNLYRAVDFNNLIENAISIDSYFKNFEPFKLKGEKNIFIIPCGGESFKKWKIENFIEVCEKIFKKGYYFYFVIGDGEKGDIEIINSFLEKYKGEILYNNSFKELISYFHSADLFIANDCGPVHIAQMMLKKTIILYSDEFGKADEVVGEWFLPHKYSRFIKSKWGKSINTIEIEEVLKVVNELL